MAKLAHTVFIILIGICVAGIWMDNVHALKVLLTLLAFGLVFVSSGVNLLFGMCSNILEALSLTGGLKDELEGLLKLLKDLPKHAKK